MWTGCRGALGCFWRSTAPTVQSSSVRPVCCAVASGSTTGIRTDSSVTAALQVVREVTPAIRLPFAAEGISPHGPRQDGDFRLLPNFGNAGSGRSRLLALRYHAGVGRPPLASAWPQYLVCAGRRKLCGASGKALPPDKLLGPSAHSASRNAAARGTSCPGHQARLRYHPNKHGSGSTTIRGRRGYEALGGSRAAVNRHL